MREGMGIIRKCNNHSFEERARAVWKEECRLSKCNARKMGPLLIFLFAVHRRMDRNFVRPHVMFEIMNVRSLVGRAESKNFRSLWDNCEVENLGGISDAAGYARG